MVKKILKWGAGIFVLLIVVGAMMGGNSDKSSSSSSSSTKVEQKAEQPKQYTEVDVNVLNEDLKNNAAAAQKKYKGQNLKITGKLGTIDSDGNYISIKSTQGIDFTGVHCTINKKDKAQEDFVLALQKDQMVTAYGTITDVGEVMGYSLKVDKFE
jgi:hypothetical protein